MKNYYSVIKKRNRNLTGLVTSYEAKMATSVMNKTNKTDKSTRQGTEHTQRTQQIKDFDQFQDVFQDIQNSLFINYEEQRKIHQILQFARKGKINQNNAFQIPVKVINPQTIQNSNLRFWKFASELLSASMCIYDKRVQNMFQTTNKVFDHLVRAKNNDQTDSNPQETYYIKSRRKKQELMRMQIAEMGASKKVKFIQIGELNCQLPQKLNIKNQSAQYSKNPLFQRALKAFDSNQLKNLFLNIFQQNKSFEITFFHQIATYDKAKEQKLQQIKQSFHQQQIFPIFIEEQLSRLSSIVSNQQIYGHISMHLSQNLTGIREERSHYLDLSNQFGNLNYKQFEYNKHNNQITELNEPSSVAFSNNQKFSFNFVTNQDIGKCLSQQLNKSIQNYPLNEYSASSKFSRQFLQIDQNDYSIMMPQQLQFKGLKIFKKNRKKLDKQKYKKQKSKQENQLQLSLQFQYQQNRKGILKPINFNYSTIVQNHNYADKFLSSKNMDPFIEIHRIRGKAKKGLKIHQYISPQLNPQNFVIDKDQTIIQDNVNALQIMPSNNTISNDPFQAQELANISTQGLNNLKTYGLRSIRQIKESLFNQLQIKKQLKLSEVHVTISPNSTFLVFLHLINQNKLKIESIQEEQDAILYYNEY